MATTPMFSVADLFVPEFTESAIVSSSAVRCIQAELSEEVDVAEMGADLKYDLSLVFVVGEATIVDNQTVTFRSRDYRVVRKVPDSANLTFRVYLAAKFGGAK